VRDEDEIRGTGKGQGRKGKKDEKKSRKGKKNRYVVLTDTTILLTSAWFSERHLPCELRRMLQLVPPSSLLGLFTIYPNLFY
jgi:hypothetical protein